MSLQSLSDKTPCFRCLKGTMRLLRTRSDNHVFLQCTNCRKIDEIAVVRKPDGTNVLVLVDKHQDEVLDESIEDLVAQLQRSAGELARWREQKPERLDRFQAAVSGWKEIQHLIFCFSGGTPGEMVKFPWQFTWVEADRELSASRTLAAVGFYKDAFKSLRSFFEVMLFGLWLFQRNDKEYLDAWLLGTKPIPPVTGEGGVIRQLLRNHLLDAVNGRIAWADDATKQFRLLSNFVHGRGKAYSNLWLWQKSQASFNQDAWNKWLDAAVNVLQLALVATVCHFPHALTPVGYFEKFGFDGPAGLFLDDEQVQVIRNAFCVASTLKVLEQAVLADEGVQATMKSLDNMPDLTTQQIVQTLRRFKESVHDPDTRDRLQEIETEPDFRDAPTVQWSVIMSLQRKVLRDASLTLIARKLDLVRNRGDVDVFEAEAEGI